MAGGDVSLAPPARGGLATFAAFRFRDFRLLWFGMLVASANRPLQLFVQSWFVERNADPDIKLLLLGVLGAVQGTATLGFGLFGGALADRMDRRLLLMVTQAAAFAISAVVALVIMTEPFGGWRLFTLLYALFFLSAAILSFDAPTRSALIPELVDRQHLTNAIALNSGAFQLSLPVSIFLAGIFIEHLGLGETYLLSLSGNVAVMAALLTMRHRGGAAETSRASMLGDVRQGLGYARQNSVVLWILVVIFATSGIGMPAIIPPISVAWFDDILKLSAEGWSRIGVFWGLFAMVAFLILASMGDFRRKGLLFLAASTTFGGGVLIFGLTRSLPLIALMNGVMGASGVVSQITSVAVIQRIVPRRYLGRIMSLVMMSFGLTQFNSITVGAVAQGIGLEATVPLAGVLCTLAALSVWLAVPRIRRTD